MQLRLSRAAIAVLASSALLVALGGSSAYARGGNPAGTPVPPAACAKLTVTNTGQTVRDFKMPDIKYNLENCGSTVVDVTVVATETASAWYPVCASPVAAPVEASLAAKQKISGALATFRGPCGYADNKSLTVINSPWAFQGHNIVLTPVDTATGEALGAGSWFSWQDCLNCGGV